MAISAGSKVIIADCCFLEENKMTEMKTIH